tara:strand:+ start:266 stop:562 length:297 start_codon:yes stop_codon:yes gene_type:complete
MAKKTDKYADGTSFHNVTIKFTVNELIDILGEPQMDCNDGEDKVNVEWTCETSKGVVFSIYDWKTYNPLDYDRVVTWHIGTNEYLESIDAREEILKMI